MHAVCAAGYNIRRLLRMIRKKAIGLFLSLFKALGLAKCLRVNQSLATIKPLQGLRNQTDRAFA
jgi:hypothetical protein